MLVSGFKNYIDKGLSGLFLLLGLTLSAPASAADLSEAFDLYYQGDYSACIEMCSVEVKRGVWNDGWSRLQMESHFALGQYGQAKEVYQQVELKFNSSLPLRFLGIQAYRFCGDGAQARKLLDEIPELLRTASYRYTDRENRIALAKYSVALGGDAREILKGTYDPILKSDPRYVDAHVAVAELALEKADFRRPPRRWPKLLHFEKRILNFITC